VRFVELVNHLVGNLALGVAARLTALGHHNGAFKIVVVSSVILLILASILHACRAICLLLVVERFVDVIHGIRVQAHVGAVIQRPHICAHHRVILRGRRGRGLGGHGVVLDRTWRLAHAGCCRRLPLGRGCAREELTGPLGNQGQLAVQHRTQRINRVQELPILLGGLPVHGRGARLALLAAAEGGAQRLQVAAQALACRAR